MRYYNPVFFILVILTALHPLPVEAKRPRGVVMTGTILSIDHDQRHVVMLLSDGARRDFSYRPGVRLWRGNHQERPESIKPGMRVQINLRTPLLGPKFTSQFVLISQDSSIQKQ